MFSFIHFLRVRCIVTYLSPSLLREPWQRDANLARLEISAEQPVSRTALPAVAIVVEAEKPRRMQQLHDDRCQRRVRAAAGLLDRPALQTADG